MLLHCATTNAGKLAEFRQAARYFGADWCIVEAMPEMGRVAPCEETGSSFEANAIEKALYYSRHTQELLFADDSGLVVDALDGAPGIYSARYAGPGATDADNNRLVLDRMRGKPNRAARFVCVVALARQGEIIGVFSGVVEGLLLTEPRGALGFGYDPLFHYPDLGCTLAELDGDRKLGVSHRGRALLALFRFLASDEASKRATRPASSRR
ncbi:MAG: RdgB/HAM1 family non-canonical purine NTP pyrophosphatase [Acidobacteriia bacterium]|nr:RdgB/HAM1 family non-canonical purine NTP pyrophosphatase [Terriglobia bacterium]